MIREKKGSNKTRRQRDRLEYLIYSCMWLHAVLSSKLSSREKRQQESDEESSVEKRLHVRKECVVLWRGVETRVVSFFLVASSRRKKNYSYERTFTRPQTTTFGANLNTDDMLREFLMSLIIRLWRKFILHEHRPAHTARIEPPLRVCVVVGERVRARVEHKFCYAFKRQPHQHHDQKCTHRNVWQ